MCFAAEVQVAMGANACSTPDGMVLGGLSGLRVKLINRELLIHNTFKILIKRELTTKN